MLIVTLQRVVGLPLPLPLTMYLSLCYVLVLTTFLFSTGKKAFECKAKVDIGFIIDSSGSTEREFVEQKDFMKNIADAFGISSAGTRAGVLSSSDVSARMIKLIDYNATSEFKRAIDQLPFEPGKQMRIDASIQRAFKELFKPANGARGDVRQVLVVLTGRDKFSSAEAASLSFAAGPLHEADVKVIVIGVGPGVKNPDLKSISRIPSDVYLVNSFYELSASALRTRIGTAVCKATGMYIFIPALTKV